ncbi:MAG TPA: hypothetical protein VJ869_02665 [Sphaerochaeta sp.]|nr:hypothetical protein [Sphaerochaeta sp.]
MDFDISEDRMVRDVCFTGTGCAICQASVSILADPHLLEASVFSAMAHMPAQIKCAALG